MRSRPASSISRMASTGSLKAQKPLARAGLSVMRPAGRVIHHARRLQEPGGEQRRAAGRGGPAKHLGVHGIAVDPQIEPPPHRFRRILVPLGPHHRLDVVRVVVAGQLPGRRPRAIAVDRSGKPAQGPAQVDTKRHPGNGQRMPGSMGRRAIDIAADEHRRRRGHGAELLRRRSIVSHRWRGWPASATVQGLSSFVGSWYR